MLGGRKDYGIEDMQKADFVWQGLIVFEVFAFVTSALLAIDIGGGRKRQQTDRLIDGLIKGEHVESDAWLLLARILAVVLIGSVGYYVLRVKPKTIG